MTTKTALIILIKIPFVLIPSIVIYLGYLIILGSALLVCPPDNGTHDVGLMSFKGLCQSVSRWYMSTARYVGECFN